MLAIIDYNMGNLRSVAKAFDFLNVETRVTNKPSEILAADHLVLPGVGAFKEGMNNLRKLGLVDILSKEVLERKKPILGICLGMQLFARDSQEFGHSNGLGWIDASVVPFEFESVEYKVPHVGWNSVIFENENLLFKNLNNNLDFYFVHSFYMNSREKVEIAVCEYGHKFTAAIQKGNIFATQFHPEKSQALGLRLLKNFMELIK